MAKTTIPVPAAEAWLSIGPTAGTGSMGAALPAEPVAVPDLRAALLALGQRSRAGVLVHSDGVDDLETVLYELLTRFEGLRLVIDRPSELLPAWLRCLGGRRLLALGADPPPQVLGRVFQQWPTTGTEARSAPIFEQLDRALATAELRLDRMVNPLTDELVALRAHLASPQPTLAGAEDLVRLATVVGARAALDERLRQAVADHYSAQPAVPVVLELGGQELLREACCGSRDTLRRLASSVWLAFGGPLPAFEDERLYRALDRARDAGFQVMVGGRYDTMDRLMRLRALGPGAYRVDLGMALATPDRDGPSQLELLLELAAQEGVQVFGTGADCPASLALARRYRLSAVEGGLVT